MGWGFKPKGANKREDGFEKKKGERLKKRETYEVVHSMTARRVGAALVIADNITTSLLVIVVVGVGARYDDAPVCALGGQARARLW